MARLPDLAAIATALLFLVLVLEPTACAGDVLSPILSPVMDEVCKAVDCGKGKCKPVENGNFTMPYHCECDRGWKQTLDVRDIHLQFLPCVIPNCTLYHSCAAAPPPVPQKSPEDDGSILNVCRWAYCGGGSCNKKSVFTHSCECLAGYNNLLNISAFPCFRECEIGANCSNLGISLWNKTTPTPSENDNSQGSANLIQNSWWLLAMSIISLIGKVW